MDIVTSHLVAFQVSLVILQVPFDNINGQPLYETPQGDQFKALEANTYNRKTYGKYGLLVIIYFFKRILSSLSYSMRAITSTICILTLIKLQAIYSSSFS